MKRNSVLLFAALLIGMRTVAMASCLGTHPAQSQDEEAIGNQSELSGKFREALKHYVAALQTASDGSDADQRLREKIIALGLKLKPPPAAPEDATTYMGRGQAAVEIAKGPEDFKKAAIEFQKALKAAPWLASGYFNLGLVRDKAGQYTEAIRSFKLYLLAAPSASDAQDVRARIAGLQYKIERQHDEAQAAIQKQQVEEQQRRNAQEERQHERERIRNIYALLSGTWRTDCSAYARVGSNSDPSQLMRLGFRGDRLMQQQYENIGTWWAPWSLDWGGSCPECYFVLDEDAGLLLWNPNTRRPKFKIVSSDELEDVSPPYKGCIWKRAQ